MGRITREQVERRVTDGEPLRKLFAASDEAARNGFTGIAILEVVAGKTVALTTKRESDYEGVKSR